MKIYHVTLSANAESIAKLGISPKFSQGKLKVVWCCTLSNLNWAIAHIAAKYDVSPEHLTVYSCNVQSKRLVHTNKRGVYNVRTEIKPKNPPTNAAVIVSADRE